MYKVIYISGVASSIATTTDVEGYTRIIEMSLKAGLEQVEKHLRKKDREGKSKKSSKLYKKFRNKWLRRQDFPNTRFRKGWEY